MKIILMKNEAPRDVPGELIFIGREGMRFQAECFLNAPHFFAASCFLVIQKASESLFNVRDYSYWAKKSGWAKKIS
jgi:hypothetical protein